MQRNVISLAAFSVLNATSVTPALAQKAPALPMRAGFYTEGKMTCAYAAGHNDGIVVKPGALSFWDVAIRVLRISRTPSGEYLLTERMTGEGGSYPSTSKIRVVNPTSFIRTIKDDEGKEYRTTYRFCSSKTDPW